MIQETEKASNVDYQLFARPASQEDFAPGFLAGNLVNCEP
jgi:hypothetical protein